MIDPNFLNRQLPAYLPEQLKERALLWVQNQPVGQHKKASDAPYPRLIDFWFAAIAWAVAKEIPPVSEFSGNKFVSLGSTPNDVRNFEEWKIDLLILLATREFGRGDARCRDPLQVMGLANRFAEAGAIALLDQLEDTQEFATRPLYRVIDAMGDQVRNSLKCIEKTYF